MRYQPTHAAPQDRVPFLLRGPKSVRSALSAAVAGAIGLVPAVMISSPAAAAVGDLSVPATATVAEGAGTVTVNVTREADGTAQLAENVTWTTADGTAVAPGDYTAVTNGAGTFPAGSPSSNQTVPMTVTIAPDTLFEANETFTLVAKDDGGATIGTTTVTITDDDSANKPSYTLNATSPVTEGTGAKSVVTATLDKASGVDTEITLTTENGTAKSGADYTALTGPGNKITVPAGQTTSTSKDVLITKDDVKDEYDTESFAVNGVATNVTSANRSATINVVDADTTPKLTLGGGGSKAEGQAMTFPVTLDRASEKTITVQWDVVAAPARTGYNAAAPGDDFPYPSSASRTVTFTPGQTSKDITITPDADGLNELPEDFAVELSSPSNATLGTTTRIVGTITDADTAPTVAITPLAVTEGDSGVKSQTFKATLSKKSGRTVTVNWKTDVTGSARGDAVPGKDYLTKNSQLVFPAGTTEQTFTVDILGDVIDENSGPVPTPADGETFKVTLSAPANDTSANLGTPDTTLKITDDDAAPTITFGDVSVKEGDGPSAALVPLKLTGASDQELVFNLTDVTGANNGTAKEALTAAVGSDDYDVISSTITVKPEMMVGYGVVLINGDKVYEGDQTAYVKATASNASAPYVTDPDDKTMKLTLENDDKAPDLEINSVKGKEGDTVAVTGTVTGVAESDVTLNVTFYGASADGGNAAEAEDFTNPGAQAVKVEAGTATGSVVPVANVKLTDDNAAEPAETILSSGFGLGNVGTVTDGVITIEASDQGNQPATVSLTGPAYRLGVGPVTLTAQTTAGASVQLWARPWNGDAGDYTTVGNPVVANAQGRASFTVNLSTMGMVYVAQVGSVKSAEKWLPVRQDPVMQGYSPAKGQVTLKLYGDPKLAGLTVIIQRAEANGTWTKVAVGTLNGMGMWSKTFTGQRSGQYLNLRGWVGGLPDRGLQAGYSGTVRVGVR